MSKKETDSAGGTNEHAYTQKKKGMLTASNKIIAALAGTALLVLSGISLSFWSFAQIERAGGVRKESSVLLGSASDLLAALVDAETAERGFMLTGDEAFLEPYLYVRDRIIVRLDAMERLARSGSSRARLNSVVPLIDSKLKYFTENIELSRNNEKSASLALLKGARGKPLMDDIRAGMGSFIRAEQDLLSEYEESFESRMRQLFAIIALSGFFTLLFALLFAFLLHQETRNRLKNLLYNETKKLLDAQKETNAEMHKTNAILQESEEKFSVTLNSIGDAVLTTDFEGIVTGLNPVAETLTGWSHDDAVGRPVDEIFRIINQETRAVAVIPVMDTLAHGTVQGLANHTLLISRDGTECAIADSCAPIRNREDKVIGAVLVFRNVTEEYAVQQALRDSAALIQTILNTVGDSIITMQARGGMIERVNQEAEHMFGYSAAELVGRTFSELVPELDTDVRNGSLEYYRASDEDRANGLSREVVGVRRDGTAFPLEINISEMRLGGQRYFTGILRDITVRKAAEAALLKAGALQSAIFNSANFSSIATDAKGVIQIFNVGAERMLGYAASEVMNKITPADISDPLEVIARAAYLSEELSTRISPGFDALVFKASRGIEDIYELTYIRKDGSRFPAVVSVTALRDEKKTIIGYLLIGTDNTARKLAEAALLKVGALQNAIFNSANFSSIATDAKGVIQIFNVGAERMLGYTAAEVMNKITPADISDPFEVIERAKALSAELNTPITPGFEALVFKASRGIEDIYELTYIRKDGSHLPAVVSVTALRDAQNSIIGFLLIGTDNTRRKQVEEERTLLDQALQDKNDELQIAKYIAEKANLAKSDFLSNMSHELRTPLSAILGFAQLMESGTPAPSASQKRSIDQILKAGWYLLDLINEILDLALVESGRLSLSLESVSLAEVLNECKTMIEPQAVKHKITVTFTEFGADYFVLADRTRLKQVLLNLLSNSLKYNRPDGSVAVECTMSPPNSIRISVRDTGTGLAPEQISQLYEPFNRLGKEGTAEDGTGIGLVVCKRLIELMGGIICVESKVGEGSVFWIEMNLMAEPDPTISEEDLKSVAQIYARSGGDRRTMLYVEDNPANLMLVEDLIARRTDIRLITARNGITGVEIASSSLPDVILMDINLPGINGVDALKLLMKDPRTARIPVIALSANAIPRDIERGMEAGFFKYLTKPIKVPEFMETLDMALAVAKDKQ